jgi:hypothetical protein
MCVRCPTNQFRKLLQMQTDEEMLGSTVWWNGKPPTGMWDCVKNVIYTDYLRLCMRLHSKCVYCYDFNAEE